MTTSTTVTGKAAIEMAERRGVMLSKYEDPTEGARSDLSIDEAREIAKVDPSLVYLSTDAIARNLIAQVESHVSASTFREMTGNGDLSRVVRQALADDPSVTAEEIADIIREAEGEVEATEEEIRREEAEAESAK